MFSERQIQLIIDDSNLGGDSLCDRVNIQNRAEIAEIENEAVTDSASGKAGAAATGGN